MNRRTFLAGTAATISLAALGSAAIVFEDSYSFIPDMLHTLVGDYRMDAAQEEQFIADLAETYGAEKLTAFAGLYRLRAGTGLGTEYTDEKVDDYERRILTDFLTSTDYLSKQDQAVPEISYRGLRQPCSNPYAKFTA